MYNIHWWSKWVGPDNRVFEKTFIIRIPDYSAILYFIQAERIGFENKGYKFICGEIKKMEMGR